MRRLVILMVVVLSLTGCVSKGGVSYKEYMKLKNEVSIDKDITITVLEDDFLKGIFNIYSPSSKEDIQKGIDLIGKYMTEDELKEIQAVVGEYDELKRGKVVNIKCNYSKPENNTDGMARLYVSFTLESKELSQDVVLEFVLNPNHKVFKHYVWYGINE